MLALGLMAAMLLIGAHAADAANSLGLGNPEPATRPDGLFAPLFFWIQQKQAGFYKLLTGELKGIRENGMHVFALAGLSFAYGIFHAAGPGHGKAVISSYMLANEVAAKRGILLAFASAFAQALTAIIAVAALALVLRGAALKLQDATRWLEIASFAGVTLLGAWLLWQKTIGGGHYHSHGSAVRAHDHAVHGHKHDREAESGHLHAPDPALLEKDFGLRQAWTAILAVGLRPCSGALIVLTFAFINGLYLAGVISTVAMALGTGITVAVLASLAVWAKDAAVRVSGAAARGAMIHRSIEIGGAALVFGLGAVLLTAALSS